MLWNCVSEAFVVCQNYNPPEGYIPNMCNPLLNNHSGILLLYIMINVKTPVSLKLVYFYPFVAVAIICGVWGRVGRVRKHVKLQQNLFKAYHDPVSRDWPFCIDYEV